MHDVNTVFEAPLPDEKSVERFPPQDLWRFDRESRRKFHPDFNAVLRRWFVFGGAALLTAYLTRELCLVLAVGGFAELEIVLIGLFVLNIAWLSLSFRLSTISALPPVGLFHASPR
jgi:membrane glycosyltransferase